MKEQLINFETAKLAKEVGFDNGCYHLHGEYDGYVGIHNIDNFNRSNDKKQYSAPTQSLLQKWLREEHNIQVFMKPFYDSKEKKTTFACDIIEIVRSGRVKKSHRCDTYEDALEEGLVNGLNLVKELNELKDE